MTPSPARHSASFGEPPFRCTRLAAPLRLFLHQIRLHLPPPLPSSIVPQPAITPPLHPHLRPLPLNKLEPHTSSSRRSRSDLHCLNPRPEHLPPPVPSQLCLKPIADQPLNSEMQPPLSPTTSPLNNHPPTAAFPTPAAPPFPPPAPSAPKPSSATPRSPTAFSRRPQPTTLLPHLHNHTSSSHSPPSEQRLPHPRPPSPAPSSCSATVSCYPLAVALTPNARSHSLSLSATLAIQPPRAEHHR